MNSLRTLLRGLRLAPVTDAEPRAVDAAKTDREAADDDLYLRDPHGTLRMDPDTAEAYVAAMSA